MITREDRLVASKLDSEGAWDDQLRPLPPKTPSVYNLSPIQDNDNPYDTLERRNTAKAETLELLLEDDFTPMESPRLPTRDALDDIITQLSHNNEKISERNVNIEASFNSFRHAQSKLSPHGLDDIPTKTYDDPPAENAADTTTLLRLQLIVEPYESQPLFKSPLPSDTYLRILDHFLGKFSEEEKAMPSRPPNKEDVQTSPTLSTTSQDETTMTSPTSDDRTDVTPTRMTMRSMTAYIGILDEATKSDVQSTDVKFSIEDIESTIEQMTNEVR